ncbi:MULTISPECIES: transposase family protein [Moorena]|nr:MULTISPECIES: transposase family protein [Moorena]NEO16437.1 transposase family protein [Moorena sp. SIO3E8]NEP99031.1 transposase family protein [Moorena sp. SIO3F7]
MKQLIHSVIYQFEALDDPRVKPEPKHKLVDIVTITILASVWGR